MEQENLPVFELDESFDISPDTEVPTEETPVEEVQTETQEETVTEIKQGDPFEVEENTEEEPEEDTEYLSELYNFYKDKGLINHEEEFSGKYEDFQKILEDNIQAHYERVEQEIVEAIPDEGKNLVEYILAKGNDFKLEELKDFIQTDSVPQELNEDSARDFLVKYYTDKLGNEDSSKRFVETLEDDEKLLDTAKSVQEEIAKQKAEQEKQKVEQAKLTKKQREEQQKEYRNQIAQKLEETKWDKGIKEKVFNEVFSGNLRAKTQQIVQHPKALIQFANYMQYFNPETGEIDEEAFSKSTFSKEAEKIKNNIERHFRRSDAHKGGSAKQDKKDDKNVMYEFA